MVILGYLALAFKIWMVFDAVRRKVHLMWFFVLMVPFGDWVYFFAIKVRDFNVRPATAPEEDAPPDLDALRERAEDSPSFANRVELAWGLMETENHLEAASYFEQALKSHRDDKDALHGLGLARLRQGNYAGAVEALSQLVDRNLAHADYEPALDLAQALFAAGQREDAFQLMDTVIVKSERIDHQVVLAKLQMSATMQEAAAVTLRKSLESFEAQPDFMRRRNGASATEARRLLRTLENDSS